MYKNFHSSLLVFQVGGLKNKLKIIKIVEFTSLTNNAEQGHDEAAATVKPDEGLT